MSSEVAARKKRTAADSTPAPDGDHRKRRRNRTTQSCLNCHTSKRMCDRKRPACARCTQLGLTGLCVYEVDDPSQRTDAQDESARLLKRVAELEGVIRELKNKPHPRWSQSATSGEDFSKWHPRPQAGSDGACSSNAPSPPCSSSPSERGDSTTIPFFTTKHGSDGYSTNQTNSPLDTPSPGLLTPTDEYPMSHIGIATHGGLSLPGDYDLASMFLSYPSLMGCGDDHFGALTDNRLGKHPNHCGCLHEASAYGVMLELSLRLRKAAEVLRRSPSHHVGKVCQLQQKITELDTLATNALSDISISPSDLSDPILSADTLRQKTLQSPFHQPPLYSAGSSPSLANQVQHAQPWEIMPSNASSPTPPDDSFMTWEPSRRP